MPEVRLVPFDFVWALLHSRTKNHLPHLYCSFVTTVAVASSFNERLAKIATVISEGR